VSHPAFLRVASWNVERAARPERLADDLRAHAALRDAAVILLQEVERHDREPSPRLERLARGLGLHHIYSPARAVRGGSHGLAILSRYPIADAVRIPLPATGVGPFCVERIALAATICAPTPFRVVDVHLDTRLDAEQRVAQIAPALTAAGSAERAVLAGDLNTTPFRFWRNNLPVGITDQPGAIDRAAAAHELRNVTSSLGPTTRRRVLAWRLDAMYTRGLVVAATGIARAIRASDHVPLWIDVTFV
jgi:endonuclease/exonuclease/phosphatase family metal-dependent hydrolase